MKFKKDYLSRAIAHHNKGKRTFIQFLIKANSLVIAESYLEYWGNILDDLDYEVTESSLPTMLNMMR